MLFKLFNFGFENGGGFIRFCFAIAFLLVAFRGFEIFHAFMSWLIRHSV